MNKRNGLRKYFTLILMFFTVVIGFSSWIIVGEKKVTLGEVAITTPVAHVLNSSGTKVNDYTRVEAAIEAANKLGTATVVIKPGVNPSINRDCTINSGVTLSIPYSLADDGYTPNVYANNGSGTSYSTSCTNTLYINDNVKIINNGIINVGGIISGGSGGGAACGQTSGNFGKIEMGSNSKIITSNQINCYGYITESSNNNGSSILATSGYIKLPFILKDFRGGTQTSSLVILNFEPFNQFELRNIQCKYQFNYGAEMYGLANVSANNTVNEASISLIGTTNGSFLQLASSDCYITIKQDKNTEEIYFDLYGGGGINTIAISVGVDLDTSKVYLPINYRINLSLNKYEGQTTEATYNATSQKIKLLTGSRMIVGEGVKFTSTNFIVYSHFDYDNSNYATASEMAGTKYPDKEAAEFVVYGTYVCNGSFGGRIIKGDNASVTASGSVTLKEPLKPGTLGIGSVQELIIETTNIVSYSDYNNKKEIVVYIVAEDNWDIPSYTLLSTTFSSNIIKYTTGTTISLNFGSNINSATFNGVSYSSGSSVALGEKNVFVVVGKKPSICFARGTLVTMSDGSQKAVENIVPGDSILSFNHETGKYESSKAFIKVNHGYSLYSVMKLNFSDNSELKLIGNHGLFDITLNRYVPITEDNLYEYLGHEFLKYNDNVNINNSVKLISAEIIEEYTESYTIASEQNMNHIINGLVGNITTVDGIYNFFEFDSNFKYNETKMKEGIEKYGLYTYEEFSSYTTEYVFNAINMKYYKISVGKGIMTYEDVLGVLETYNALLENGELEQG